MKIIGLPSAKSAMALTLAITGILSLPVSVTKAGRFPEPSVYPLPSAWYLNFKHGMPKRIVVAVPGDKIPTAYWYLPYTVTNNTGKEQDYFPHFEMVTEDGKIHVSDQAIPLAVFQQIKKTEGNDLLQSGITIAGTIHQGEDQAKDGVAIWPEPMPRMGNFSIYAGGLNSEALPAIDEKGMPIKDDAGLPIKLWKTLQMNYVIYGDEIKPGLDEVHAKPEHWLMR